MKIISRGGLLNHEDLPACLIIFYGSHFLCRWCQPLCTNPCIYQQCLIIGKAQKAELLQTSAVFGECVMSKRFKNRLLKCKFSRTKCLEWLTHYLWHSSEVYRSVSKTPVQPLYASTDFPFPHRTSEKNRREIQTEREGGTQHCRQKKPSLPQLILDCDLYRHFISIRVSVSQCQLC